MARRRAQGAEVLAAVKLMKSGKKELDARIRALVAEYVKAEARIAGELMLDLAQGRMGTLRARRQRIRDVRRVLSALDARVQPRTRTLVKDHFRLGSRAAERTRLFDANTSYGKVNREAIQLLADNLEARLDAATTTVGRRVEDVLRREGLRVAASQIAGDSDLAEASRSLQESLVREGVTSFEDRRGRRWGLESYAEMALRTTTSEAIAQGTQTAMLARGFDLIEINRTKNPCKICQPYDGGTFSLTGATPGYKKLEQLWPWHPRCEHFGLPSKKALAAREARRAA